MPDIELMDQVMALITAAPAVHEQDAMGTPLWRGRAEEACAELAAAPPEIAERVPSCGAAHCFGGWALILRGYRFDPVDFGWQAPGGERVFSPLIEAAVVLGINYDEAYDTFHRSGIFWEDNDLDELALWVRYYKGEIDRDDLEFQLGLKADA